jgi:hypothetical protein
VLGPLGTAVAGWVKNAKLKMRTIVMIAAKQKLKKEKSLRLRVSAFFAFFTFCLNNRVFINHLQRFMVRNA